MAATCLVAACSLTPAAHAAKGVWTFHSVSFRPPAVSLAQAPLAQAPNSREGDIFLAPRPSYKEALPADFGPMILNQRGQLVWFDPVTADVPSRRGAAANLQVQSYRGQPVLTWWQGTSSGGLGEDVIMDSSYRIVSVIQGDGHPLDLHEFQITPQGTALVYVNVPVPANLTSVGGPADGIVLDNVIEEQDIQTHRILWKWDSLAHVPISASYYPLTGSGPYGYFHLNSIQQLPDGDLLISARHTWAVYLIDRATGRIIWTLGGKHSSFRVGPRAHFEWQHDARLVGSRLTVFDNGSDGPSQREPDSSVKVLWLDTKRRTASLMRAYHHSPPLSDVSQGSAETLPDGNLFVGWGADPRFSEYNPAGAQILDGSLPFGVGSYRAFRFLWTGRPVTKPALAVSRPRPGNVVLYASWNGATRVARWRVLSGPAPASLGWTAAVPRTHFETAISLRSRAHDFAVQALDATGRILGRSAVVTR